MDPLLELATSLPKRRLICHGPEVGDYHYNEYHIQVTDGYISPDGTHSWQYGEELPGTTDLLWRIHPVSGEELRGAWYDSGLPKSTWSLTIDPSGFARLYDGPDAGGSLLREEALDPVNAWFVRFMVADATSAGFPAGDARLTLLSFCPVP